MADLTLLMPKLGLTMTEGTLVEWKILPGQSFCAGETLCIVETEKIANDVEAPNAGMMREHLVEPGMTVAVGTPVAYWRGEDCELNADFLATPPDIPLPATAEFAAEAVAAASIGPAAERREPKRLIATPLARKLAADRRIDLRQIRGTGPHGRIRSSDLPVEVESAASNSLPPSPVFFIEAQIGAYALSNLLKKVSLIEELQGVHVVHLAGLAAARVLRDNPRFNQTWTAAGAMHLTGVAVSLALPGGDIVVQDTGSMSLRNFVARAAGNAGTAAALGIAAATSERVTAMSLPLRDGWCLSLGLGAMRATFRCGAEGEPVAAKEMTVVLSSDSRVFDYAAATEFLAIFSTYIEAPLLILAEE